MSHFEQVRDMMHRGRIECPICGAGWNLTKSTDVELVANAIEAHVAEHKKNRDPNELATAKAF
jgi:uncharacterized Zn finger protein (UPF0148 family)